MIGPDPLDNAKTALIVEEAALDTAANASGAVAARIVPPYEFQVDPNANSGIRNDGLKTPPDPNSLRNAGRSGCRFVE